jgi:ribosome-associated protein
MVPPNTPSVPAGERDLRIDEHHAIPRDELDVRVSRSGGPGGQHVNVTSSRVEVRWAPARSRALSPEEQARVSARLATRLDRAGILRVVASSTRSQRQNRDLAEQRLAELVAVALRVPKPRKATKPSRAVREARLAGKRRQSEKKRERRREARDE